MTDEQAKRNTATIRRLRKECARLKSELRRTNPPQSTMIVRTDSQRSPLWEILEIKQPDGTTITVKEQYLTTDKLFEIARHGWQVYARHWSGDPVEKGEKEK